MANQLSMVQVHTIESLHKAGYSNRRIARTLGVDRGTANKHVRSLKSHRAEKMVVAADRQSNGLGEQAGPTDDKHDGVADCVAATLDESPPQRSGAPSQCEAYRELIVTKLEQGLSATRIHQDLQSDHGFGGSYYSVRRFVRKLEAKTPLPFRRIETEPGEEAQIDFGTGVYIADADGKQRRPWMLRVVLSHSRKAYSEAVWRQTTDNFLLVLENAFQHFGGVPKKLVIDNLKAAVARADWYDPELHPKLQSFAQHYGAAFVPTKPYTPRHKGKVENGVKYAKDNALKGHVFPSLGDQNDHLLDWETNVADTRIHGTTKKQVRQQFEDIERAALLPLPRDRFPSFHEARRTVGHRPKVGRATSPPPPRSWTAFRKAPP